MTPMLFDSRHIERTKCQRLVVVPQLWHPSNRWRAPVSYSNLLICAIFVGIRLILNFKHVQYGCQSKRLILSD